MIKSTQSFYLFILVLFFSISLQPIEAQSDSSSLKKDFLIVGVVGNEPFVFEDGSSKEGISIEIWNEI